MRPAATVYGSARPTYDIDIIVDLKEDHIQALAEAYPLPRYYADPEQMRSSIQMGISFNIIDTGRGEKADLSPLTRDGRYGPAFGRRIRQRINWPGAETFEAWCARPDDVIYGKLLAWKEGRSRKHESDIYDMLVFRALEADPTLVATFDEAHLDAGARALGPDVVEFWESVKKAAQSQTSDDQPSDDA
jgi:hypothetical protein